MKISVKQGDITSVKDDAIVVNLLEGVKEPGGATAAVDAALGGQISRIIKRGDFTGKLNQTVLLPSVEGVGAERVLVVGLGKQDDLTVDRIRQVSAKSAKTLREAGAKSMSTVLHGAGAGGIAPEAAAAAVAEGAILGTYSFLRYKTDNDDNKKVIASLTIVEHDKARLTAIKSGVARGEIMAQAGALSRDLAVTPSSDMTPALLAQAAEKAAKESGLSCTVLGLKEIKKLKMGAFLGVAQGSREEPKFIILEHKGKKKGGPLVLVGKAITFDSGGISIKPSQGMEQMKYDMSGGAAVIGAMTAIARLKLPVHVIGLVPATENMPGGAAFKPGDVLTAMNGKTMEIISTDAEGRLILADALSYACSKYKPSAIVDIATLTGACAIALGPEAIGLMGTDEGLVERLRKAGDATGERAWPLPLWDEYAEMIKSDIADMKNVGSREGGAITAGCFLKRFVDKDIPWAHLDIAGVAWQNKERPYLPKGPTGVGARLLAEFAAGMDAN